MLSINFILILFTWFIQNVVTSNINTLLNNKFLIYTDMNQNNNLYLNFKETKDPFIQHIQLNKKPKLWEIEKTENKNNHVYFKLEHNGNYYYICQSEDTSIELKIKLSCKEKLQFEIVFGYATIIYSFFFNECKDSFYILLKNGLYKDNYISFSKNKFLVESKKLNPWIFKIEKDTFPLTFTKYKIINEKTDDLFNVLYHVVNPTSNQHYFIKKRKTYNQITELNLSNEIKILQIVKYKWTTKFHFYFKEYETTEANRKEVNNYLIFDYMEGNYLSTIIQHYADNVQKNKYIKGKYGFFPLKQVQFHAVYLFRILINLQENNIFHNDIKPDNLILNKDGLLTLINFSTSKIMYSFTSKFILGSTNYKSPEVLYFFYQSNVNNIEYSYLSDIWSIGVILYEMLTGELPYNDQYIIAAKRGELTAENLNQYINLDKLQKKSNERDFISKLLVLDSKERLKTLQEISEHPWFFNDFDWKNMEKIGKVEKTEGIEDDEIYKEEINNEEGNTSKKSFNIFIWIQSKWNQMIEFFKNLLNKIKGKK